MKILPISFYQRDTVIVAKELIGKVLVRKYENEILMGTITETEAYRSDEPACHAFGGKTKRNAALFGPVGHTYVYFSYGCHFCMNIVARDENVVAGGVLIRAIKPIKNIEIMRKLRGSKVGDKNLTNGPGKLTQALAISRADEGINVTKDGNLYIMKPNNLKSGKILATPRIGISQAKDKLWRFVLNNKSVTLEV